MYIPYDRPAISLEYTAGTDYDFVRELTKECVRLGFTRISVELVDSSLHDLSDLSRSLVGVPRTVLVVNSIQESLSTISPRHTIIRNSDISDPEIIEASRSKYRTLVASTAAALQSFVDRVRRLGVDNADEIFIFDFTNDPFDLSSIRAIEGLRRLQVWDELIGRRLIITHPCYSYLCAQMNCHRNRVSLPRRLSVNSDLSVTPYSLSSRFSIGELRNPGDLSNLLQNLDNNKAWHDFRKLVKEAINAFVDGNEANLFSTNAVLRATEECKAC